MPTTVYRLESRTLQASLGEWDVSWLSDGSNIAPGDYELNIEFAGRYSTDSLGMHRVTFEDNDYVFTQMEAMAFCAALAPSLSARVWLM